MQHKGTVACLSVCSLQEEDVIGVLARGEKIGGLQPLGDRILIQVSVRGKAPRELS